MTLRVALVGGPMYDHLYRAIEDDDVEIVVHADHPTLNRAVAAMLAAGERIDLLATHSKYAPSQRAWLRPLDDVVDRGTVAALAPRAVDLCRFDGSQWCLPRLIDVRLMWARSDRVATLPDSFDALASSDVVVGFPGRESGLFGTFYELVVGVGGRLFDEGLRPTMATPEAVQAIELLRTLAARAPTDLCDWHYDDIDRALLTGRVDAAGVWPGGWAAIRDSDLADRLVPHRYPAGRIRRAAYAGCHAWAIPATCGDVDAATEMLERLLGAEAQALDAAGGSICAHRAALAAVRPLNANDALRLELTREMIEEAMITYPAFERFPEIEDAGWTAIREVLCGRMSAPAAAEAIQHAAVGVLG